MKKGLFSFGGKKPGAKPRPAAATFDEESKPLVGEGLSTAGAVGIHEDVDPLDAFMTGVKAEAKAAPKNTQESLDRFDDEEDDPQTAYMLALEKKNAEAKAKAAARAPAWDRPQEAADVEDLDSDEEVYALARAQEAADKPHIPNLKTAMAELSGIDHASIEYAPFEKVFYEEDPEIFAMSEMEVLTARRKLDVRVSGVDIPRPISTFDQVGLPAEVARDVAKHGYTSPTPIQCQAIPVALSGRDVLGIAKTGSGKTAAFLLPMLVHILDQDYLQDKDGPIGCVMAPTRELSQQIYSEAKKFSKTCGVQVAGVYGGASKNEQRLDLLRGAEIMVGTPGRLIDMLRSKATNCRRVTFLVLDEADRMLDMGFEAQIRCVLGQIRPDRQTLMFSATFKKRIRELADTLLQQPVHITVGSIGEASADVRQVVRIFPEAGFKWTWLMEALPAMVDDGEVLIFVAQKTASEELSANLVDYHFRAAALHGDKQQQERDKIFHDFKAGRVQVLVATDVAARGLDVPTIRNVICWDPPRDKDTHTHRIGRTGRAGEQGAAYSLLTRADAHAAGFVVRSLQEVGQPLSEELVQLAQGDSGFRYAGAGRGRGGAGLPRPGGTFGGGAGGSTGAFAGRRPGGRGRGGGFGLGFDKTKADGASFGGSAGLGLSTATGSGGMIARKRLVSDFQSSFVKGGFVEDQVGGVGGVVHASGAPLPPAGRGAAAVVPAWKKQELLAAAAAQAEAAVRVAAAAAAAAEAAPPGGVPPPPPGGVPPPPPGGMPPPPPDGISGAAPAKKRKSRWES